MVTSTRRGHDSRISGHVPFHGFDVSHPRVVRIESGTPAGSALVEQIPTLVQAYPQPLEPLPLVRGQPSTGLLLEQLVLFVGQLVDPPDHVSVFHCPPPHLSLMAATTTSPSPIHPKPTDVRVQTFPGSALPRPPIILMMVCT